MKKTIKSFAAVALALVAAACSSPDKMAEMAENLTVGCEPAVLEVVGGKIDADVTVTYPADYFHPKAILEVTPVIVYEGGEVKMEPFVFQGEKVKDNYLDGLRLFEDITYADSMGNTFFALPDNSYFYQNEEQLLLFGEAYLLQDGILEQICETDECIDIAELE